MTRVCLKLQLVMYGEVSTWKKHKILSYFHFVLFREVSQSGKRELAQAQLNDVPVFGNMMLHHIPCTDILLLKKLRDLATWM